MSGDNKVDDAALSIPLMMVRRAVLDMANYIWDNREHIIKAVRDGQDTPISDDVILSEAMRVIAKDAVAGWTTIALIPNNYPFSRFHAICISENNKMEQDVVKHGIRIY